MVSLFVFVKPLYYTGSCLTSIFYIAGVLLVQQDNHMGSALFAAAIACGHLSGGIVFAGLMVSLQICDLSMCKHCRRCSGCADAVRWASDVRHGTFSG